MRDEDFGMMNTEKSQMAQINADRNVSWKMINADLRDPRFESHA